MKKYTDYYSTPLKFHKFFHYVWTPLMLISSGATFIGNIISYSGFNNISAVIATFALLNTGLVIAYFTGFFRWKKYSWYCLYIQMVTELVYSVFQYFVYANYLPVLKAMAFGGILGVILRSVPIGIYYYNRRALFTAEGFNPKQAQTIPPQQTTVPQQASQQKDTYSENIIFCPGCGIQLSADSLFCTACGISVAGIKSVAKTAETAEISHTTEIAENTATVTENTAPKADPADNIIQKAETAEYIAPKAETSQSAETAKAKKMLFKGKVSAKMFAVCTLAAVLAILNVVQLVSASNLRTANQQLQAKADQLEETVQDYSQQLIEERQFTAEDREKSDKANRYEKIVIFVTEEVHKFNSQKFYTDNYVVIMAHNGGKQTFTITADFADVTVSFHRDGMCVDAEFAKDWDGNNIDVELIPNAKGTTKLIFTNDANSDSFTVLVVVV